MHGRTAGKSETLRALKVISDAGTPALVVSYRNDPESPPDPSDYYQFGVSEWEDIEAWASYAVENGAERLVLIGFSMGGGIVSSFIQRSDLADSVTGIVLDAPMLDFRETVNLAACQRDLPFPGFLSAFAMWTAAMRFGVELNAIDYLRDTKSIRIPVLLFHGRSVASVPVATSRKLADLRPDVVRFASVPGAGHVASWNVDPERYEAELAEFIASVR